MAATTNKTNLLYAVGVGLLLSDIVPTPADAYFFYRQRKNNELLERGNITAKQYWLRDAMGYYGYNAIWWGAVLGATHAFGKTYEQKRNILVGLLASGLVVGVIAKNIQKDEQRYASTKTVKPELT